MKTFRCVNKECVIIKFYAKKYVFIGKAKTEEERAFRKEKTKVFCPLCSHQAKLLS